MPSSTLSCQIVVSVNEYTVRTCIATLGNASDINCHLPSNTASQFSTTTINLLGILSTERQCITHSYAYDNLPCICPAPSVTKSGDLNCYAEVYAETHLSVSQVQVRALDTSDRQCVVPVYEYSDTSAIAIGKDTSGHSIACYMPIAAETLFSVAAVDVGYTTADKVWCTVTGELRDDMQCCIVTNTKVDDKVCILHEAVDIDAFSEVKCIVYLQAGEPVDYVAIEVSLADREISTVRCIAEIPEHNYSDLLCATSYVVAGPPRWNRFTTSDSLIVRLMNLGDISVSKAVLQDPSTTTEAMNVDQVNSVWQVTFDRPDDLGDYVVVVTLSNGKVVVVDRSKSQFSL